MFPIGQFTKVQIRNLAKSVDLATQNRRDSQGLCFLGQIKFSEFIREHLGNMPGEIIDIDSGDVMGEHQGFLLLHHWTASGTRVIRRPLVCGEKRYPEKSGLHFSSTYDGR